MKLSEIPNFGETAEKVRQWAEEKNIHTKKSIYAQFTYLCAEYNEYQTAENGNEKLLEAGDVLVVLTVLFQQYGFKIEKSKHSLFFSSFSNELIEFSEFLIVTQRTKVDEDIILIGLNNLLSSFLSETTYSKELALYFAYEKIKNRKGKTINGTFIKEQ